MKLTRLGPPFLWLCLTAPTFAFGSSDHQQAALGASPFLQHFKIKLTLSREETPSKAAQFTPLGHLSALSQSRFTVLEHPSFPNHQVRVKKTRFCDGTVNSYTGYIDIGAKHLFFYFFESRSKPERDDVILWTNGGPGCSSSLGLFMELGPCRIMDGNTTKFHPESWNIKANVFFIDQPIGVGFSYADYGEHVGTSEEAAKDITAFIHTFFEHFPKFKGLPFHMAGESYAGRYLPVFAAHLYDFDRKLTQAKEGPGGLTPVKLTSLMIGNGMPDYTFMLPTYYEMACTGATVPPILPPLGMQACVRMKQAMPRCTKKLKECCIDTFDKLNCQSAIAFCEAEMMHPIFATSVNPYDLSVPCEGGLDDALCYPLSKHIPEYLNRTDTRSELGAHPGIDIFTTTCSDTVLENFLFKMDRYKPTRHYVSNLLDRGIRVLMYAGANDLFANHIGTERWTMELEWSGMEGMRAEPSRDLCRREGGREDEDVRGVDIC
ncbi:hypothetical protein NMY22_g7676 [Coprinellus aureogranulatus]|nr:hypothetical protein NMY22_g7676 [Coprinellus aureogranulatus]